VQTSWGGKSEAKQRRRRSKGAKKSLKVSGPKEVKNGAETSKREARRTIKRRPRQLGGKGEKMGC